MLILWSISAPCKFLRVCTFIYTRPTQTNEPQQQHDLPATCRRTFTAAQKRARRARWSFCQTFATCRRTFTAAPTPRPAWKLLKGAFAKPSYATQNSTFRRTFTAAPTTTSLQTHVDALAAFFLAAPAMEFWICLSQESVNFIRY